MQQIFDLHGQLANPDSSCMVNRSSDCRSYSSETDFSDATCTIFVQSEIRIVKKGHIDLQCIRTGGNHVVGEIAVDGVSGLLVVMCFLKNSHTYTHHDRSPNLIPR